MNARNFRAGSGTLAGVAATLTGPDGGGKLWVIFNDDPANTFDFVLAGQTVKVKAGEAVPVPCFGYSATINGTGAYRWMAFDDDCGMSLVRDAASPTGAIADNAVTAAKIAASVAGAGLAGGGGSALSVNVDDSTIEINSDTLRLKNSGITSAKLGCLDTDGTMAANSDTVVPSQKAVKTYVATAVTGLLDFKGSTNCGANPTYPAASKGDAYIVTGAGRIGGGAGTVVDIGDVYFAVEDNAGGTEGAVGASWGHLEHNLVGALLAANNLSDIANAATARTNLGLGSLATQAPDGIGLENSAGNTQLKDGGITAAKLGDGVVTDAKLKPSKASALAAAGDQLTGLAAGNTSSFATTHTIGAGKLKVGSVIRVRASGRLTTKGGGSNQTEQVQVRLGGVVIGAATSAMNLDTNGRFRIDAEAVIRSTGAGGKFCGFAQSFCGKPGSGNYSHVWDNTVDGAIDTTASNDVDVQTIFAADAAAGDKMDLVSLTVQVLDSTT